LALVSMADFYGMKGAWNLTVAPIPWAESDLRLSTFLVLASYIGVGLLIKFYPDKVQFAWQESLLDQFIKGIKSATHASIATTKDACRKSMSLLGRLF